jgi:hypothetical protein
MIPFAALVVVGWSCGTWLLGRRHRLDGDDRPPPATGARVSIIVPARDEAASLPTLLQSLDELDDPPHELIVVDDGSRDATADIARTFGATVLDAGPPPVGWAGKPWACTAGADRATGTHLVFLDADTSLASTALRALLAAHAERGGLLSVQPAHITEAWYEQASAYCNIVAMMGTGAFAVRSRRSPDVSFGPCLVTTAADYARVGGHAAVASAVLEDVHLARRYRAAGLPVVVYSGGDAVRFRMYPNGLHTLVEGWTKNLASGARDAYPPAAIGASVWVSANAAIAIDAIARGLGRAGGTPGIPWLAITAYAITAGQLWVFLRRAGRFRAATALFFPAPLAVFVAIFLRSLWLTIVRRRVTWRGRILPLGSRRAYGD